ALSAAIAADLASAAGSCARAFAILAVLVTLELDGFRDAFGRFVQREGHIAADVAALARPVATAAKQVAKDVAECRENILDVGEVMDPVPAQSGGAEAVVPGALVRIVENFERLGRFLEPFDGVLVAWVFIGVVLDRQPPIGGGDLVARCRAFDTEDFVIVA